ncbi:MAG: IS3 family transposase [Proteobacteria bacterium]|nr:IS3 family transposase [Pseudomonadota bacterium]
METRQKLIDKADKGLSVREQCVLMGINRSTVYYEKQAEFSGDDLKIMRRMDEIYTENASYGYRRQEKQLKMEGYSIGEDRVRKYMQVLGLKALYPNAKKKAHKGEKAHKVYPYLLKNISIERPNQVWAIDITYVRLKGGFCYLVSIIDWYSRYIVGWRLSNSLDRSFCIETFEVAVKTYSKADIINTDQGSQFTSDDFVKAVTEDAQMKLSMDSVGRWADNIIIERWFRTFKHEHLYLMDYSTMAEARFGIDEFIRYYNDHRLHSSLGYVPPRVAYFDEQVRAVA